MRLVLALLIGVVTAAAVACSAPSVNGTTVGGNSDTKLPSRDDDTSDDDDDASSPDDDTTTTATTPDAGTTTATTSTTCTIANAALCFTFEGSATNLAVNTTFQPTVASGINYVPGHENQGAEFTSITELQFAANAALELPAGAGTIEAWIKRQDTGGDAVVFDDDGRFSLTIQQNGTMICKSSGGSAAGVSQVPTGSWAHVACVVDGHTVTAYLNGAVESQSTGSIGSAPANTASIGANAPPGSLEGDQVFVGVIDSFRLLNVARAATDIATDARSH